MCACGSMMCACTCMHVCVCACGCVMCACTCVCTCHVDVCTMCVVCAFVCVCLRVCVYMCVCREMNMKNHTLLQKISGANALIDAVSEPDPRKIEKEDLLNRLGKSA